MYTSKWLKSGEIVEILIIRQNDVGLYCRNLAFDSGFQKKMTKAFSLPLPARIRRRYFRQLQPHVRWRACLRVQILAKELHNAT